MTGQEVAQKAKRFFELAQTLCEKQGLPVKSNGSFGTRLCLTFHGQETANRALLLLSPALDGAQVARGFDPGKTTEIANARRRDVCVWRLHGWIKGNTPTTRLAANDRRI
jgi:hypothetical protein